MISQLELAVPFALLKHEGQMYGDYPYVIHLIEVDSLVVQVYADKERTHSEPYSKEQGDEIDCLRTIAYLHDVIEDTDATYDDLRELGICDDIIAAIAYITKVEGETYHDYIAGVNSNTLARKVKLCDTAANLMNSIKEGNTKRINKYSKQIQLLGGF